MKTHRLALFFVFAAFQSALFADEFVLVDVEARIKPAPIIVAKNAPPMIRQAANELAGYIEKSTGKRPPIVVGSPSAVPQRAIWIGVHPELASLFENVDFEFKHPEEIVIAANDSHLVIAGRDRWDPEHLTVEGIDEKIVGRQQEYGTVNAIYSFLQGQLGIRWFWPGELGEDVPRRTKVSFEPFVFRYHPQIRARAGAFNYSVLSNRGYGRAHQWSRRQRLQLGSLQNEGGHAFGDWWDRFHEKQPDLFALQPDGTRSGHPNPRNAKLCQSNPAVWRQWMADVEAKLKKDPLLTVFNASPNDSWSSGHCVCEKCRAWDHVDGEPRLMHWYHHRETRPALSDRHVTFANRLAALLKKRYPDKDYRVLMLCYGHSRPAPIEARPADNVIMMSVANFFGRTELVDRGSTWGTTHRDQFAAWGKVAPHLMWRPNTGSPAGWQQGLPDLSMNQTIKDIKFIAENHCIGIYIDAEWEHWATQGPQNYILAQLIWNPKADSDQLLEDYYRRAFGPAASHVRSYFESIETARMAYVAKYGYGAGVMSLPRLYSPELLQQADEHLMQALAAVEKSPAVFRLRVEFVKAGADYTNLLIANMNDMRSYWKNQDKNIGDRVVKRWQTIEELVAANPYAINWGPVRPSTPRMAGLHPEFPNPKWKPGDLDDLDKN